MKKLISMCLSLVMVLALVPSALAAESDRATPSKFTDVPADAWYWNELDYAMYNGYISGTSATTFSPDSPVTRGQFVTILGRMLRVDADNGTTWFMDVPETAFYAPYVGWAASKKYVNGTSSTTFAPNNNITVEQMGAILANYIRISETVLTGTTPQEQYTDVGTISGWAKDNMELMRQYDLLPVDGKGNVSPRKAVSRAEATVSLVRLAKAAGWGTEPDSYVTPELPVDDTKAQVVAKVNSIHDELWASKQITSTSTEKEKAIAYFRWMCINTDYGCRTLENPDLFIDCHKLHAMEMPWESHCEVGPLLLGRGVCDGLAYAYKKLLDTEGISSYVRHSNPSDPDTSHAYNMITLDGKVYEIDMTEAVGFTAWADGTLSEVLFKEEVQKRFYPEEWQKQFEGGFGDPLTEEEIQQLLGE